MPYVSVAEDNSAPIDLYYEDHGAGPAVVLVHGFPWSSRSLEKQVVALYCAGFRVVAYDRRGFGRSSRPAFGYDVDTLAADLHALIATLELRDVALVGCGTGGSEVARFFGRYGSEGARRVAFVASPMPSPSVAVDLHTLQRDVAADRFSFARRFIAETYAGGVTSARVSCDVLARDEAIAAAASPFAMCDGISIWAEDFRSDLARVHVPALIVHGDADRVAPIAATGRRMPEYLRAPVLLVVEDAPHAIAWTHAERVNAALIQFLR